MNGNPGWEFPLGTEYKISIIKKPLIVRRL